MKKMYKYLLDMSGVTTLEMPTHAIVKHVAYQNRMLTLWAEVDTDNPLRANYKCHIEVLPTGAFVGDNYSHLATVHDPDGFHIWHIYEVEEDPQ